MPESFPSNAFIPISIQKEGGIGGLRIYKDKGTGELSLREPQYRDNESLYFLAMKTGNRSVYWMSLYVPSPC
jgi:hypothetical protein